MKARRLFGSTAYGPDVLKLLFEAFDKAWASIAPTVGSDPQVVEAARTRLANIILALANNDPKPNPDDLADRALRIFGPASGSN